MQKYFVTFMVLVILSCANATFAQTSPIPESQFITVKGGTFKMGDVWGDGDADEKPVHTVTLTGFKMSKYEVTNSQFAKFLNAYGSDEEVIYEPITSKIVKRYEQSRIRTYYQSIRRNSES